LENKLAGQRNMFTEKFENMSVEMNKNINKIMQQNMSLNENIADTISK